MIHYDIQQGSEDWFKIRYIKVGGSTSSQLHVKSDTLLETLLGEMCEPWSFTDSYTSDAMQRGNDLEPLAVEDVSKYVGKEFTTVGWVQSDECKLLGASPDAISLDSLDIIETKCPSAKAHISYIRGKVIPPEHIDQCVHYFATLPSLERVHFASYRPECVVPLFVVTITRDSMVNVGTKARPVMSTVGDYAQVKIDLAKELEQKLEIELNQLTF